MSTETSAQLPLVSLYLTIEQPERFLSGKHEIDYEALTRLLGEKGFSKSNAIIEFGPGHSEEYRWVRIRKTDEDITLTDVIAQGDFKYGYGSDWAAYHAFVDITKEDVEKNITWLMQQAQRRKTEMFSNQGNVAMLKIRGEATHQPITHKEAVALYLHSQLNELEREVSDVFRSITRFERDFYI